MKILKILSHIVLTLLFVTYIAYQFRTDPIGLISGTKLSGEEVSYPADWAFTSEHSLIAVETRIGNPHSVTTVCFVYEGDLYVPAQDAATKDWPAYVMKDGRARVRVGEKVYPVMLTRANDLDLGGVLAAVGSKYPQFSEATDEQMASTWLFRVSSR
jgi:hypothetical protein